VRYCSTSPAEPITPKVRVCGDSGGGDDESVDDVVGEDGVVAGDVLGVGVAEDPEESHAASRVAARRAPRAKDQDRCRPRPVLARTAETLTVPEKTECAGPGAPHGAWPLVAADCGTRGCRGPAHTDSVTAAAF
jgi:hypothetical protein